jgi:pimeloyl-ACP methyl ester carboxylesterase
MINRLLVCLFVVALLPLAPVFAQGDFPIIVEVETTDGLTLVGDFYLLDPQGPTVLLLHQLYTTRASWEGLIPSLLDAGYNVLAVDLRGHGATRGGLDWNRAVTDVQVWLDWLRSVAGVRGDAISLIGSSMGSSLALLGCANDADCRTAIAISPGWSYQGLSVEEVFTSKLGSREVFLIYAARDRWPRLGVPKMVEAAPGQVSVQEYRGNAHGIMLLDIEGETLIPLIIEWLDAHRP